jgi:hypothetical protein
VPSNSAYELHRKIQLALEHAEDNAEDRRFMPWEDLQMLMKEMGLVRPRSSG